MPESLNLPDTLFGSVINPATWLTLLVPLLLPYLYICRTIRAPGRYLPLVALVGRTLPSSINACQDGRGVMSGQLREHLGGGQQLEITANP